MGNCTSGVVSLMRSDMQSLDTVSRALAVDRQECLARVVRWFAAQPQIIQVAILHPDQAKVQASLRQLLVQRATGDCPIVPQAAVLPAPQSRRRTHR